MQYSRLLITWGKVTSSSQYRQKSSIPETLHDALVTAYCVKIMGGLLIGSQA